MRERRSPGTVWCLSRTNLNTYVRTEINDHILIVGPDVADHLSSICLTRSQARTLAKRINQCLDSTRL